MPLCFAAYSCFGTTNGPYRRKTWFCFMRTANEQFFVASVLGLYSLHMSSKTNVCMDYTCKSCSMTNYHFTFLVDNVEHQITSNQNHLISCNFTLFASMECSIKFGTVKPVWSIIYIELSQLIISKKNCISFFDD